MSSVGAVNRPLVALTGATGFIGQCLLRELPKRGYRLRVLLRRPSTVAMESASAVVGDLARPQNMAAALADVDAVIHSAGVAHAMSGVPEDDYRMLNTEATIGLARSAQRAGAKRFVFLSSIRAQSGPAAEEILTEDLPPQPTDAYGRSKLAAEQGWPSPPSTGGAAAGAGLRALVVRHPGGTAGRAGADADPLLLGALAGGGRCCVDRWLLPSRRRSNAPGPLWLLSSSLRSSARRVLKIIACDSCTGLWARRRPASFLCRCVDRSGAARGRRDDVYQLGRQRRWSPTRRRAQAPNRTPSVATREVRPRWRDGGRFTKREKTDEQGARSVPRRLSSVAVPSVPEAPPS